VTVICDRSLVGTVSPGTRVTVCGVYAIQAQRNDRDAKGAVAIRNPYVRCALLCGRDRSQHTHRLR